MVASTRINLRTVTKRGIFKAARAAIKLLKTRSKILKLQTN